MRPTTTLALSIAVCLVLMPKTHAQEVNQRIDEVMAKFVRLGQFSGCILVAKDGEAQYAKAFGEANKDHHVKNTLQTKFNIGSAGKTFTGISIMQLAEEGKLEVTDPVTKYLEDFPFGDEITIHHLLTHTSGMGNYFAHPEFPTQMSHIRSVSDALPLIYDQEPLFKTPGEQYAYSNSGIVTLGAIIEKVSGQGYGDYVRESILDTAEMYDTDLNYWDEIEENRASGYIKSPTGGFASNIFMVPPANADGGLETTVDDLLKYDQALYGERLLSEESREKMFTPFRENYGYCWRIKEKYGNTVTWHSGGAPGVSASFRRYLDDRYTLIVLSNYSGGATQVSRTIEAIIFGDEYEHPKPSLGEFLYQSMKNDGIDYTVRNAEQLLNDNGYEIRTSRPLNFLGYVLMGEEKLDTALGILKLNVRLFPDEANPYDSLGDAYIENGDTLLAIGCFERALEKDPQFESSKQKFEQLTEKQREEGEEGVGGWSR